MFNKIRAFTLIEILVVLVIITIITAVAVLVFSSLGGNRKMIIVADEISHVIPVAQQSAILLPATLRMSFDSNGFVFTRYKIDEKTHQPEWVRLQDDRLSRENAFHGLQVHLLNTKQPQILIYSDGDMTPAEIEIRGTGGAQKILKISQDGVIG